MEEIKIQKMTTICPWIVAVLIIGALVYYIFVKDHEANSENSVEIENTTSVQQKITEKQWDNIVLSRIKENLVS